MTPMPMIDRRPVATRFAFYVGAVAMVALSTLVGLVIAPRWGNSAVDLLYLPAVLVAAILGGLRPALLAALGS
ncbi:MAG TPA: DUF4118 domain-containing protein, partial [Sphingomicrobium sp.]|nr:DUF4118 domain-containing protein [Sphingomicrobium sp.]